MTPRRRTSPLLLLPVLAFIGFLLISLPPLLVGQYRAAEELGQGWGYFFLATVASGGAILVGCSLWIVWRLWRNTRRKRKRKTLHDKSPGQLSPAEQQRQLRENLAEVADLRSDDAVSDELRDELGPLVRKLEEKQESRRLEIVAFGTISGGKSSLLNALAGRDVFATDAAGGTTLRRSEVPWPGLENVTLVDTPGLGEVDAAERAAASADAAKDADLVLLVVDGPLKESESQLLKALGQMEKPVLVCLNKEDWYGVGEKESLLEQIAGQAKGIVAPEDIVVVRSAATTRTRVRVSANGTATEESVELAADIRPLAERMMKIVRRRGGELLLANLLLQSRGLIEEARSRVRRSLDRRAWEIVRQHMWGAGGAAALSPLPVVDLAVGCAVSTKMVVDLARVYRQDVDTDVAVRLLGQLGKSLLGVLGASAATPVATSAVASLLKTVPGAGTIAGGMLQGLVMALVTRWIGAVFIEYFRGEMQEPEGGLTGLARRQWEQLTTVGELRRLIRAAGEHFGAGEKEEDENG